MNGLHDSNFTSTLINAKVCTLVEKINGIVMEWGRKEIRTGYRGERPENSSWRLIKIS